MNNLRDEAHRRRNEAEMIVQIGREQSAVAVDDSWPPEVDLILSAMEAAAATSSDRRQSTRRAYRARGELKLYAATDNSPPLIIYTRDADARGIGFITQNLLPLGYGGWITLVAPNGEVARAECMIYRCRRTAGGWHEGALRFNREMWQFD